MWVFRGHFDPVARLTIPIGTGGRVTSIAGQAGKHARQITLRDGRRLSYLEQGSRDGKPVSMIHNMPYGTELPRSAIHAAIRLNLRILVPFRPGYGHSDALADARGDELLNEAAGDMYELLDRLNIPKAVIAGVKGKVQKSATMMRAAGGRGVPNLIVGGTYRVTGNGSTSQQDMLKIVDFLVQKIRNGT